MPVMNSNVKFIIHASTKKIKWNEFVFCVTQTLWFFPKFEEG